MIDLHSHVLPGIDDGPSTVEGALAMARAAVTAGTRQIVATPHIDHRYGVEPHQMRVAVEALTLTLRDRGIPLEVVAGGELGLARVGDLDDDQLRALRLGDGPYLLVECPHVMVGGLLETAVFELQARGHAVLLAHPERCPSFHDEPERLRRLVEAGSLTSITASSLSGRFGRTVRRFALELLRERLVHDVASDAHDDVGRPPGLLAGIADARAELPGLDEHVEWLTRGAPAAILAGAPLPSRPAAAIGRRRRLSLRRA